MRSQLPVSFSNRLSLFSFCALAISVSLGVALVSISKVLIGLALLVAIPIFLRNKNNNFYYEKFFSPWLIVLALTWMGLSFFWTDADNETGRTGLARHARLLLLPISFFLICLTKKSNVILKCLVMGQLFVVISSWTMYLGISLPWSKNDYPTEMGILFSSTLEQPVMSTLMLIVVWHLHPVLFPKLRDWMVWGLALMIVLNVFFVMTGRTGYVAMFLAIALAVWLSSNRRQRFFGVVALVLLAVLLGTTSTRLRTKVGEIKNDIVGYSNGNIQSSQGQRLDYWHRSLLAVAEKPLLGHGVGSWKKEYLRLGGEQIDAPSNPHNQYLLWAVEGGLVGLALMLGILLALYKDAKKLEPLARRAMLSTLAIVAVMGLFNCPFFGAGIGEFFLLMFGSFLAIGGGGRLHSQSTTKTN
jgi:O-antigen ligase